MLTQPVHEIATLCLSTPDNTAVLCVSVPYHPLVIAGAMIRFAAEHCISAAMVEYHLISLN